MRLRELAQSRPRYGYLRLLVLLRREGWTVNHKRVYRLYCEEGLSLRTKKRPKRKCHLRVIPAGPSGPNERWSMDFVADRLVDGRRFRILTMVDLHTRECLALEAGFSLSGWHVTQVLEQVIAERGTPRMITVDNGSEFVSKEMDAWADRRAVRLDFIRPGKPVENCFIESFNGKLRDECLNSELFWNLDDTKRKLLEWKQDYNYTRPHSSLGDVSPAEFAAEWRSNRPEEGQFIKPELVQSAG